MFRTNRLTVQLKKEIAPSVPIEQFPAKDFFNNPAGWSRNDIAALAACTTMEQYKALLPRLAENDAKFNVKDGEKIADSLKKIIPRWCQSSNEIMNFAEGLAASQMDDAYAKALEDVALNKDAAVPDVKEGSEVKVDSDGDK